MKIMPLTLDLFESLPPHPRRCVFWEVEPDVAPGEQGKSFSSEFDKEAWLSMVMLEWGTCAQIAVEESTDTTIGVAFYAPPGRVPRARSFPTAPVSADAVLLTSVRTAPGHDGVAEALVGAVVADLVRRGVRAVEAFGIVRSSATTTGEGEELCPGCVIDAHFLKESGFDVVASHPRFPRLRLELDEGLGWKSGVEAALQRLFVIAQIDLTGSERAPLAVPVGSARHRSAG
ncbi:hypothetical protein SAMN05445060_2036 [Williamsia sterculiae]|uniref:N-acetyltransferase domain-containing protein n=1 Tax=Williamsia sterculiae TaxID=1344003 RepID=A0A1N7FG97_9NOCA|nr:hypothetical protein SAMN05445060_2036 [Williamsia sterculiae]